MSITIPTEYVVFTREVSDDDPDLATYGLTRSELLSLFNAQNIYLNSWDRDVNYEIIVTMVDSPLNNFNEFSDILLSAMTSTFESEYKKNRHNRSWL